MKNIYHVILSGRDLYSFLAGIIVSGYVVELSLNTQNLIQHWLAVAFALLIGLLLYILRSVSKNYEDNMAANLHNLKTISSKENKVKSWSSINDENQTMNRVFGLYPRVWLPICLISIPLLSYGAVGFLYKGTRDQQDTIRQEMVKENMVFIWKMDSLNSIHRQVIIESLTSKIDSLKDMHRE